MKKIRIGNDIVIKWRITINGEEVNLEGLDLSLYISTTYQPRKQIAFTVAGNEITATYKGTEQKVTGIYRLTLYRNEGENSQSILDACDAFELVSCSCLTVDAAFGGAEVELPVADLGVGIPGLSAYEIAVAEGFKGTQEEWLASLSAASEAAAAECREFTDAAKIDERDRQDKEALRVTAEDERAANERTRALEEQNRVAAESLRVSAEVSRKTAEEAREADEQQRTTAEVSRSSAEELRNSNEQSRISEETTRSNNEAARIAAETKRANAESTRKNNEDARKNDEITRTNNELIRQKNENARVTAETNRATAESQRVTSETARSEAESSRATAETARQTAETARQEAEQGRVTAEHQRADAEAARAEEFATFEGKIAAKEDVANKVTAIVADADDAHYPSAKAVWSPLAELALDLDEVKFGKTTELSVAFEGSYLKNINTDGGSLSACDYYEVEVGKKYKVFGSCKVSSQVYSSYFARTNSTGTDGGPWIGITEGTGSPQNIKEYVEAPDGIKYIVVAKGLSVYGVTPNKIESSNVSFNDTTVQAALEQTIVQVDKNTELINKFADELNILSPIATPTSRYLKSISSAGGIITSYYNAAYEVEAGRKYHIEGTCNVPSTVYAACFSSVEYTSSGTFWGIEEGTGTMQKINIDIIAPEGAKYIQAAWIEGGGLTVSLVVPKMTESSNVSFNKEGLPTDKTDLQSLLAEILSKSIKMQSKYAYNTCKMFPYMLQQLDPKIARYNMMCADDWNNRLDTFKESIGYAVSDEGVKYAIKCIFSAGDMVSANYETKSSFTEKSNEIFNLVKDFPIPFLCCLGNHDICQDGAYDADEVPTLAELKEIVINGMYNSLSNEFKEKCHIPNDEEACYYYYDDDVNKVRIIALNDYDIPLKIFTDANGVKHLVYTGTHLETNKHIGYSQGNVSAYSKKQLEWLVQTLMSVPTGYMVITNNHVGLHDLELYYRTDGIDLGNSHAALLSIINAFWDKTSGSAIVNPIYGTEESGTQDEVLREGFTISYDFSVTEVVPMCHHNGHVHTFEYYLSNGGNIPCFQTMCVYEVVTAPKWKSGLTQTSCDILSISTRKNHESSNKAYMLRYGYMPSTISQSAHLDLNGYNYVDEPISIIKN